MDEDVIRTLLDIPLWEITNLDQPSGIGDKKILREVSVVSSSLLYHVLYVYQNLQMFLFHILKVAKALGLHEAAVLPKRAIQVALIAIKFVSLAKISRILHTMHIHENYNYSEIHAQPPFGFCGCFPKGSHCPHLIVINNSGSPTHGQSL